MEEATRYAKNLDDIPAGHPFAILRSQIVPGVTVLDIGCGSGDVGAYLARAGIVVDGVEPEEERAAVARTRLRRVVVGKAGETLEGLEPHYTVSLVIDVLEHLADPIRILRWAAERSDTIFAFIPNAAHYSARLKILRGDWRYDDVGIFDRDHLRFWDLSTMEAMISEAGLCIEERWPSIAVPGWAPSKLLARWPKLSASAMLLKLRLKT